MSYSRFSTSTWYTFWAANSEDCRYKWPTKKLKNNQVFQICDFPSFTFTYGKLKKVGIDGITAKVQKFYSKNHRAQIPSREWKSDEIVYNDVEYKAKKPSNDEIIELVGYIKAWEDDVDNHFRFWTFIKREWWVPTLMKIRSLF